ncbi:MAG: hypothetical protein ACR2HZ_10925, partial [Gemmatimonadaceae bacterium]
MPMRGYNYFEEYTSTQRAASTGNVIAVPETLRSFVQPGGICLPVVCAGEDESSPNSPVSPTFLLAEYLGTHCKRVTEVRARSIHPRLFEYLETVC